MQRNPNSNRSKKWIARNDLLSQDCVSYVNNLCESYGIEHKISGNKLFVYTDEFSYRVYPDFDKVCLIAVNRSNGKRTFYEGDSCWIDFVKDVTKKK